MDKPLSMEFFRRVLQRSLGLSAIFWETSAPWERSGGRSECAGWSAKEERWGRGPSKLVHLWKPQKQKQGKPEARDAGTKCGLHAYYLELLNGSGTSMAILIALTTFERPTLLISKPSLLLPWTCDNYGLVLFSVVAECNVYNKSSLLLS